MFLAFTCLKAAMPGRALFWHYLSRGFGPDDFVGAFQNTGSLKLFDGAYFGWIEVVLTLSVFRRLFVLEICMYWPDLGVAWMRMARNVIGTARFRALVLVLFECAP